MGQGKTQVYPSEVDMTFTKKVNGIDFGQNTGSRGDTREISRYSSLRTGKITGVSVGSGERRAPFFWPGIPSENMNLGTDTGSNSVLLQDEYDEDDIQFLAGICKSQSCLITFYTVYKNHYD